MREQEQLAHITPEDLEEAEQIVQEWAADDVTASQDAPVYHSTFQGYEPKSMAAQRLRDSVLDDIKEEEEEEGEREGEGEEPRMPPPAAVSRGPAPTRCSVAVGSKNPVKLDSARQGLQSSLSREVVFVTG